MNGAINTMMNCNEAAYMLFQANFETEPAANCLQLQDHIRECKDCRRFLESNHDFKKQRRRWALQLLKQNASSLVS